MKRHLILFGFMIIMFFAATMIAENGYAANWTKRSIAMKADTPSIVIDQNENPHLFYVQSDSDLNDLMHSWFDGRQWHSEKIDTFNDGSWSSATVDQEGNIYLAYGYDIWTSNPQIKYAFFDGSSWTSDVIEDGGFTPTVTIAPDGFPRIVHVSNNLGTLRYLSFDGVSWTGEDIVSGVRGNLTTSMAYLPDGTPVVAWTDDNFPNPSDVHVALREGSTWNSLPVLEGTGGRITIDHSGTIHLIYNKGGGYAHDQYENPNWVEELLTTSTQILGKDVSHGFQAQPGSEGIPDIAVDEEGTLHVIFDIWLSNKIRGTTSLFYGFFDGTGWHSDNLAHSGPGGGFNHQIVLNPQGIPQIGLSRIASVTPVVEYYQHTGKKLSVSVKGDGTVTSDPKGIDCGSNCNNSFFPGMSVTLTATPSSGSFLGWSGACQGTNSTCTLIMDKPNKVTAKFGQ